MLKFNRKFKKLVIPVGINPSHNIDSSTLYNTSDATATANDIISGKVSYSGDGKLTGTLDIDNLIEESYNEGVNEQKSKLTTITITENGTYNREDGYNEVIVEVPDLNGSYDEGYNEGVVAGREEIISEQSDATITSQTVFKGEIGYGSNNERIIGEFEYVEGFDFGKIDYSQELSNELNNDTAEKLAYSKSLYDAWDPNRTSAQAYFYRDSSLFYAPNVNCSNIVNGCQNMFYECSNLTTVPPLNTSNCEYFGNIFYNCTSLTSVGLIDTSSAKGLDSMFYGCSKLTSVPELNTSNVTNMERMFFNCNTLTTVPLFDTTNVTDMNNMFYFCSSLTSVPLFDTTNVTDMERMFYRCSNLTTVPLFDTSNVNVMDSMFYYCEKLTSVPLFNTTNVTNMKDMFYHCSSLTSVPQFDTSNVTTITNMFQSCEKLTSIPELDFSKVKSLGMFDAYSSYNSLTSLGGFINAGKGVTGSTNAQIYLKNCRVLSYDSIMNVINKAYDMTTKTDWTGRAGIVLYSNVYSLLSPEDIAIATNKGWTVQAG